MDEHTTNLLNAESAVEELQAELKGLTKEAGNYASARSNLDKAQQAITQLIEKHSELAQKTASVIGKIAEIDTPKLLQGLDHLTDQQLAVLETNQSLQEHIKQDMAAVSSGLKENTKKLEATNGAIQERLKEDMASVKQDLYVSTQKLNESNQAVQERIVQSLGEKASKLEESGKSLQKQLGEDVTSVIRTLETRAQSLNEQNQATQDQVAGALQDITNAFTESRNQLKTTLAEQTKILGDINNAIAQRLLEKIQYVDSKSQAQAQEIQSMHLAIAKRLQFQTILIGVAIATALGAVILSIPAVQRLMGG